MLDDSQNRCSALLVLQVLAVTGAILCTAASGVSLLAAIGAIGSYAIGANDPNLADEARVAAEAVIALPLCALVLWRVVAMRKWACAVAALGAIYAAGYALMKSAPLASRSDWMVVPADVAVVVVTIGFAVVVFGGWRRLAPGF